MDNTTCLYSLFICAVESQLLYFALYGKISKEKRYVSFYENGGFANADEQWRVLEFGTEYQAGNPKCAI